MDVSDRISILVTSFGCWYPTLMLKDGVSGEKIGLNCHQHLKVVANTNDLQHIWKLIFLWFTIKLLWNSLKSLWTWLENRETRWIEVVGFPLNARFFRKLSWSCSVSYLGQSDSHPPSIHLDVFTHVTFEGIWIQLEWHTLDSEIVTVWPKNQKPNLKYCKPSYFNF